MNCKTKILTVVTVSQVKRYRLKGLAERTSAVEAEDDAVASKHVLDPFQPVYFQQ